jgi:hypothetical protein
MGGRALGTRWRHERATRVDTIRTRSMDAVQQAIPA